jgi:hypothetical protein
MIRDPSSPSRYRLLWIHSHQIGGASVGSEVSIISREADDELQAVGADIDADSGKQQSQPPVSRRRYSWMTCSFFMPAPKGTRG